jgi:signal transduction histidine kinase
MVGGAVGWRVLARRQWPLALALALLLAADLEAMKGLPMSQPLAAVPGAVAVAGLAVVAPRWPVACGAVAAAVVVLSSVLLWAVGGEVLGSLGPSLLVCEVGALMALTAAAVRQAAARAAVGVVALLVIGGGVAQVVRPTFSHRHVDEGFGGPWGEVVASAVVPLVLSVGAGLYLRRRDRERDQATLAAVAAARQGERLALARELHDVVAHHVGVMVVQAQAAQAVAGTDAGAAARVLPLIEGVGGDALIAMRRLVGALRDDEPGAGGAHATTDLVADLRALTSTTPGTAPPVALTLDLVDPVPAEIAPSVLRLVQESLTNARRHAAGASLVRASVATADGMLRVQVCDDGHGARGPALPRRGYGLIGMRERAELLGGTFVAGPAPGGGWRVAADLPLRGPAR